jgi:hypothetical protein
MHPLGVDQITRIENKGLTCEISDTVEDYQKRRKALLETATL